MESSQNTNLLDYSLRNRMSFQGTEVRSRSCTSTVSVLCMYILYMHALSRADRSIVLYIRNTVRYSDRH